MHTVLYIHICLQIGSHSSYAGYQVWVSFFEIYSGKLFDLLNDRKKLICREDAGKNVNVVGLRVCIAFIAFH